jgi:putative NADH-flavin reductase
MRLTVVAATGGIGRELLAQAVAAGHDVTAVVRHPDQLPAGVRAVTADLSTAGVDTIRPAVEGADAVLSALGQRSRSDAGVCARGTSLIVDAMHAADVHRLIVVSAAPLGTVVSPDWPLPPKHDPGDGFWMRHLGSRFATTAFRRTYADLAVMEDILRSSGLDWTAVRPPRLTDKPLTGDYRTAYGQNLKRGVQISRADVAHLVLALLDDSLSLRATVGVAY